MGQSGLRQTVNFLVKVAHVVLGRCFLQGAAKSLMWLATICSQAQIVGLGRRQHLVAVEYVCCL